MSFSFSDKLIAKLTAYFREKYGVALSHEEANECLDSLADLYRCLERSVKQGFGSAASRLGGSRKPDPLP